MRDKLYLWVLESVIVFALLLEVVLWGWLFMLLILPAFGWIVEI